MEAFAEAERVATEQLEIGTSLQEEADIAAQSTANQIKMLKNEFTALAIELGESLLPVIKNDILPLIKKVVDVFSGMTDESKKNVVGFGALAAAFLLVAGPLLMLLPGIATLVSSVGGLGITLGAAIPLLIAVVAIVGAAIVIFKNWGKIVEWFKSRIEGARITLQIFKNGFLVAMESVKLAIAKMVNFALDGFQELANTWIDTINLIIKGANKIPGVDIPLVPKMDLTGFKFDTDAMKGRIANLTQETKVLFDEAKDIGTGMNIFIENVNGTDPDDMVQALRERLNDRVATG